MVLVIGLLSCWVIELLGYWDFQVLIAKLFPRCGISAALRQVTSLQFSVASYQ